MRGYNWAALGLADAAQVDRYADMAREVVEAFRNGDGTGLTWRRIVEAPHDGYMVGGLVPESVEAVLSAATVREFLTRADVQAAYGKGAWVGIWLNPETDRYHLDMSQVITSELTALVLAENRGELAIFDVANGVSIDVHGTSEQAA